jgi:hypothetical protein
VGASPALASKDSRIGGGYGLVGIEVGSAGTGGSGKMSR